MLKFFLNFAADDGRLRSTTLLKKVSEEAFQQNQQKVPGISIQYRATQGVQRLKLVWSVLFLNKCEKFAKIVCSWQKYIFKTFHFLSKILFSHLLCIDPEPLQFWKYCVRLRDKVKFTESIFTERGQTHGPKCASIHPSKNQPIYPEILPLVSTVRLALALQTTSLHQAVFHFVILKHLHS